MPWTVELRGGDYDGWTADCNVALRPLLIAWECPPAWCIDPGPLAVCDGHLTFDPSNPAICLATALAYRFADENTDRRVAIYEIGDLEPGVRVEDRELVGADARPGEFA